jgi:hypothetical protein
MSNDQQSSGEPMNRKCVLLRVGIDDQSGGMQSPMFKDRTFEFICIPDDYGVGVRTYGNTKGRHGRPLVDYFLQSRRTKMNKQPIHLDPEFDTFTYGDPASLKRSLKRLRSGDFLVFYCGLQNWDEVDGWSFYKRPSLYLVGYFEVSLAGMATEFDSKIIRSEFGNNFHVRHRSLFRKQKEDLVLVKGSPNSRLFKTAYLISQEGVNIANKPIKVLSSKMQKVFGTFTDLNAIERSPPRWVADAYTEKAITYLKSLE